MRPSMLPLALIAPITVATAVGTQTIYRAQADVVVIDVAVADGRKPVTHLTKDDFQIRDNGVVQAILDVGRESLPLDVTMIIDVSGSMTPADRTVVERAMTRVSGALRPADRASVITFGSDLSERTPLRHPPIQIDIAGAGAGSSVLDALLLALVTPAVTDRRQLALVMTDGQETSSFFDGPTVVETAKHSSAATAIVLSPNRASGNTHDVIKAVARTTGGETIELQRGGDLSQAFLDALENFRTSYMLRYTPAGVEKTGWHDVSVTVTSKKYTVRARRGYSADRAGGLQRDR